MTAQSTSASALGLALALALEWALGLCCAVGAAQAQTTPFSSFTPLTASVAAGALPEAAPLALANASWVQLSIADRTTQLGAGQFNSGWWDMIDSNRTGADIGRYLFTGFEIGQAGIQRTDRQTGQTLTLWSAPTAAPPLNSASGFDAARWTPFGSFITAEESWGAQPQPFGRLFELTNPTSATAGTGNLVLRNGVARVAHEGLAFDSQRNLYFVDELNGGSIYRYSSATLANGSSFFAGGTNAVLRVGDGLTPNATGAASWISFTDAAGVALPGAVTITDPNGLVAVDGRASSAMAAFKGTGYQRPEDMEIQTLSNGDQVLYFATTTTHEVYSLNLTTNQVRLFVSRATLDAATGLAVGAAFTNPDNLAIDAAGNLYIVEDQPAGQADIWFATDANRDGVAESIGRWASLSTLGAEPTGLYFDVSDPNVAFINVQHPSSGVDRTIQITAVPDVGSAWLMVLGLGLIGAVVRRHSGRATLSRPAAE